MASKTLQGYVGTYTWAVQYQENGTSTAIATSPLANFNYPWAYNDNIISAFVNSGGSCAVNLNGTITATLAYKDYNGQAVPFSGDRIFIQESDIASWWIAASNLFAWQASSYIPTVSDGLGGHYTENAICDMGVSVGRVGRSMRKRLSWIPFTPGASSVTLDPVTLSVALGCSAGYVPGTITADGRCYYDVQMAQPAWIESPTIDQSYHKSATGPMPNVRNADQSIDVDTVVAYNLGEATTCATNTFTSHQPLVNNSPFFINPVYSWTYTGAGIAGNWYNNEAWNTGQTVHIWHHFSDTTTLWPRSGELSVNVSDDPMEEPAQVSHYRIRWHLPYENWIEYGTRSSLLQSPDNFEIDDPGYAFHNGSIHCTWSEESAYWGAVNQAGIDFTTVGGSLIGDPLYAGLFAAVGLGLTNIGPKSDSGSANFNDCWLDSRSTGGPSGGRTSDSSTMDLYHMVPSIQVGYTISYYAGEQYGKNGYTGDIQKAFKRFNGTITWLGDFELNDSHTIH